MYYLRSQAATQAVQFTVEKQASIDISPVAPNTSDNKGQTASDVEPTIADGATCTMQDGCISCGS
jgi:ribonucleoside-diphosphate reductase alpha chain